MHGPTPDDEMTKRTFEHYRSLVGDLLYLAYCIRPDLAYVVSKLGTENHDPTKRYWYMLEATVRYV